MKKLLILGLLIISTIGASAAYINSDVYDYLFEGTTANIFNGGCTIRTKQTERFTAGVPPFPQHSEFTQFTNSPNCYNGMLVENRWTWTSAAMTSGSWSQYWDGVFQTGGTCTCADKTPKRMTEMSNYANKSQVGSTYLFSRYSYANTRFWINATTNGLHHIKVKFTGGWWASYWPGSSYPGDLVNAPASGAFNFATDGVRIRGLLCDANGEVTFYWNPVTQGTLDCTPSVDDAVKSLHWEYELQMWIIP